LALPAPDGGDFKLSAKAGDAWYSSSEAGQLATIVLSYQAPCGGWSKHVGYSQGPRKPAMQWTSQSKPGHSPHYLATFDNRSTTEQLHCLANVWQATQRADCQAGFAKGLKYLLAAQQPGGGWPQVFPLEGDYHDDITFNDDAQTHILELLLRIINEEPQFGLLDDSLRREAKVALERGLQCVLATQLGPAGKKTGWAAQYDALTLQPSQARQLEPAALSGSESAQLIKFMMTIPDPTPEVVESIEQGLAWLKSAQVTGIAKVKAGGKTGYVSNPNSTEVYWARFYDLQNGRPIFPGRDGVVYESFAELAANNSLGYDYYSNRPGSIVTNGQKKWRKLLAKRAE
jgi:PelA/Pel-15E family pectate lyase